MNAFAQSINPALQRLGEVAVRLSVELGRTDMALRDVIALSEGSVVSLDKLTDELLDITANGRVIAQGEVIAQDSKFALRIVSLAGGEDNGPAPSSKGLRADVPAPGDVAPSSPSPAEAESQASPKKGETGREEAIADDIATRLEGDDPAKADNPQ